MLTKIIAELMVHSSYDVKESCRIYLPEVNAALSTQEDVKRRRDLMQIYEKYTASTEDE